MNTKDSPFERTREKNLKKREQMNKERALATKLRDAIGFCKEELEISAMREIELSTQEKINFEHCLTKNYLVKHGFDYFGKRDVIYLDMFGTKDVARLMSNKYD